MVTDDLLEWRQLYYLVADRVATDDPKLPKEIVWSYIQRACTELSRKSSAHREDICIDVQCGMAEYPIDLADDYAVVNVLEVTYLGQTLEPINPRLAMRGEDHGYYLKDGWLYLTCCPQEDCKGGIHALVSTTPTRKSCGIREDFAEANAEAISAFVMWKIHSTRNQLYDPSLASKEYRLFNSYVSEAEEDAATGSTNYHDHSRAQRIFGRGRRRVR